CFFFQAEDGIRDYKVTGVQTCALPISDGHSDRIAMTIRPIGTFGSFIILAGFGAAGYATGNEHAQDVLVDGLEASIIASGLITRSEERRVGKECRSRWWA